MDFSQFLMMRHEIGLLIVFLVVFLFDTFMPKKCQSFLPVLTAGLFTVYTVVVGVFLYIFGEAFGGMYEANATTEVMKSVLNIGVIIVLLQSCKWANSEFQIVRRGEFYELLLITLLGMYLMISARHFLLFVIGLETASLPIAALVAFDKKRYESHEAAAKYMFTAIFSSAIFMMGISFVYAMSGSLYFVDIAEKIVAENQLLLFLAIAFVISGMGFKLSLVPYHLWTADVYQGAPTAITSYLSVISKGAAAYAFFIMFVQVFGSIYAEVWSWMLYALIILTITVGNLFAIRQKNLKRFLAFSSISQAGYIMLGIISSNAIGMGSMIYFVLIYIFSNLAAFGVISAIENNCDKVGMDDYKGLYKSNPRLAVVMMLAMFSLAGIPPFAGFFSKFFIFAAATQTGSVAMYVLVFIALLNTIISLYYYLLVVKAMFVYQDEPVIKGFKSAPTERLALVICLAGILLLGLFSAVYEFMIKETEVFFNLMM
ncbi:MAG: NADH-quinone oxidoreductase subunit N [Bacteroidales bacterium]